MPTLTHTYRRFTDAACLVYAVHLHPISTASYNTTWWLYTTRFTADFRENPTYCHSFRDSLRVCGKVWSINKTLFTCPLSEVCFIYIRHFGSSLYCHLQVIGCDYTDTLPSIPTVVINMIKKCQYNGNKSLEDGSKANFQTAVCIKSADKSIKWRKEN